MTTRQRAMTLGICLFVGLLLSFVLYRCCTVEPVVPAPFTPIHYGAPNGRTAAMPVALFVANPVTPTVTHNSDAGVGTATWSYKIVGVAADGSFTAASSAGTTTTGLLVLSAGGDNIVNWASDPVNAVSINVYRTVVPSGDLGVVSPNTTGLIGNVAIGVKTLADTGLPGDGSTPPSSNGTGNGVSVNTVSLGDLTIQVSGTFNATIQIQGKIDPAATWLNIDAPITTTGVLDVTATGKAFSQMRVQMTAFTSGLPVVTVGGH